jgi:hypothetical protein
MVSLEFLKGDTRGCKRRRDERKFKRKLSEVNTRAVSRGQNELISKFKMAAVDVISIRGQVIEYTYIPTGIKRQLVRSGVNCDWKG